jgi:hypothetical protein
MLLDWCIALGSLGACFAGGWAFVSSRLLASCDDKETGVQVRGCSVCWVLCAVCQPSPSQCPAWLRPPLQVLWSSTFAFSCNLLLLVVFEILNVIDSG